MREETFLKRARSAALASTLALLLAATGTAFAQQIFDDAELVTAQAKVTAVDVEKRTITLQTSDGRTHVLKVGPQVTNLAAVKAGDVVKAAFYQSIALEIRQPGPGGAGMTIVNEVAKNKQNTLPGGAVVESVAYTSEIVGIEPKNNDIVVIDPAGAVKTIQITDPKMQAMIPSLKLGDKIDVIVTEGLAVGIEPAK